MDIVSGVEHSGVSIVAIYLATKPIDFSKQIEKVGQMSAYVEPLTALVS